MEGFRNQLRMTTLKCVDPHASTVVATAGRTALYNFDQAGEAWSKTDVEGTLMIYTRAAKPRHMITIVNKNSKSNFIEPITKNCDAQLKTPYVLLRNDKMKILGIWFADQADVSRIYEAISGFIKIEDLESSTLSDGPTSESLLSGPAKVPSANAGANSTQAANSEDIMSMLCRAHGEYETKRTDNADIIQSSLGVSKKQAGKLLNSVQTPQNQQQPPQSADILKPSPVRASSSSAVASRDTSSLEDSTQSNTVADFFAKVGGVGLGPPPLTAPLKPLPSRQTNDNSNTTTPAGLSQQSANVSTTGGSNNNNNDSNSAYPMLQQLFQGAAAVGGQATVGPKTAAAVSVLNNNNNNSSSGGVSNPVSIPGSAPGSVQTTGSQGSAGSLPPAPMSLQELEGKLRENLQVCGLPPPSTVTVNSNREDVHQPNNAPVPFNDLLMGVPNSKPNLIAPQMFTVGKGTALIDDMPLLNDNHQQQQQFDQDPPLPPPPPSSAATMLMSPSQKVDLSSVPFRILPQAPPGMIENVTTNSTTSGAAPTIQELLLASENQHHQQSPNKNEQLQQQQQQIQRIQQSMQQEQQLQILFQQQQMHSQQNHLSSMQQQSQKPPLSQSQFVMALSHALTKEDFVRQLYEAYEEVVLNKPNC